MKLDIPVLFLSVVLISACQKNSENSYHATPAPATQSADIPVPVKQAPLRATWKEEVSSLFVKGSETQNEDGIAEFTACFKPETTKKTCTSGWLTFAKEDSFRHITFFEPVGSSFSRFGETKNLRTYISLPDCSNPKIILTSVYSSKASWLFMNQISVLADKEVVLERSFEDVEVHRENYSYGVNETASWIASDSDLDSLRKISTSKTVIIRISGKNSFVTMEKREAQRFQKDAAEVLSIYSLINSSNIQTSPTGCRK